MSSSHTSFGSPVSRYFPPAGRVRAMRPPRAGPTAPPLRAGRPCRTVGHPAFAGREYEGAVMTTRPIVVGYDGSDGARAALHWALDEADRTSAPVRLVYAFSCGMPPRQRARPP